MKTALTAITSERNATSSRTQLNSSTTAMTMGVYRSMRSIMSANWAGPPPTRTRTGAPAVAAGMRSLRSSTHRLGRRGAGAVGIDGEAEHAELAVVAALEAGDGEAAVGLGRGAQLLQRRGHTRILQIAVDGHQDRRREPRGEFRGEDLVAAPRAEILGQAGDA